MSAIDLDWATHVNTPPVDPSLLAATPSHVPADLVCAYPFVLGATTKLPPHSFIPAIHRRPEVFWVERAFNGVGGAWVPRTLELLRQVYMDNLNFWARDMAPYAKPRRWVLKYPNYIMSMGELSDTYPDGLFVVSHRDPVRTLASLCDLTYRFRAPRYSEIDRNEVGQEMLYFVQQHVDHLLNFRVTNTKVRIVDIDYNELVTEPVAVVEAVYAAAEMDLPQSVRGKLADWTQRNPKGKRGIQAYRLEDYGLDRGRVEAGFAAYRRAFNISKEGD